MKKIILVFFTSLLFSQVHAQDMGYNTTDIGGGYQWFKDGSSYQLHLAFNAKTHHSIIVKAGYANVPSKQTDLHDSEQGSGWGGGWGYRYYFGVMPKRFFIGAQAEFWALDINWSNTLTEGTSKVTVAQPGVELGYTLLLNDLFFITPHAGVIKQINLKTKGAAVNYGDGLLPVVGISAGWRF